MKSRGKRRVLITLLGLLGVGLALPAAGHATFPGANGKIYFAGLTNGATYDIYSVNPDGTSVVNVTSLSGIPGGLPFFDPSVSANGLKLTITRGTQATSEVWSMGTDGSNPVQVTNNTALDIFGGISPDGSRVAFTSTRDAINDFDIWLSNTDGTGPALLLNGPGEDYYPEFTPDGQTVVLTSEVSGDQDVASVPSTGGPFNGATGITEYSTVVDNDPSVAPSGARVAFVRREVAPPFDPDLYSVGIDGTNELPIATDPNLSESGPAFSPDGTKLAFTAGDQLVIANADGSNPAAVPLPATVTSPNRPDWAVALPATTPPETTPPKKKKCKKRKGKRGGKGKAGPAAKRKCKKKRKKKK
jgi:Tol biopolymer transport system component